MKADFIGHIMCINCHLRYVIEENRRKGIRGRWSKHLLDEFKETERYGSLKEDESDRILWRIYFRMGYGPVLRQTML